MVFSQEVHLFELHICNYIFNLVLVVLLWNVYKIEAIRVLEIWGGGIGKSYIVLFIKKSQHFGYLFKKNV